MISNDLLHINVGVYWCDWHPLRHSLQNNIKHACLSLLVDFTNDLIIIIIVGYHYFILNSIKSIKAEDHT